MTGWRSTSSLSPRMARTVARTSSSSCNGMPLALFELKNPADEHSDMKGAWNQIQTYRNDIAAIFDFNAVTVVSDGVSSAAMSSFTGAFEHYAPWKTIDGRDVVTDRPSLEVLIRGVFEPSDSWTCFATSWCSPTRPRTTGRWLDQAGREVPPVLGGEHGR